MLNELRVATRAIPDHGEFDPQRLPHRWFDRRLLVPGRVIAGAGLAMGLLGVLVLLESRFGKPYLRQAEIPGEAWTAWLIAALLLYAGLWLTRCWNRIEIRRDMVRVEHHRLFSSWRWQEPLGAYRGMAMTRTESTNEDTINVWTTWTVALLHEDASRTVSLYSRMLSSEDQVVSDHRNRVTDDDPATCEERALALCRRWAQSMGIPMLEVRDDLEQGTD